MIDALCEVRSIYQANIVEVAVDVEQREEVEIPRVLQMVSLCVQDGEFMLRSDMEKVFNVPRILNLPFQMFLKSA